MHHGASKNKIYDSELFIKKMWKIDKHTRKEKLFSPMNLDPPPKINLFFYVFFQKNLFIRLRIYIYIQIELV